MNKREIITKWGNIIVASWAMEKSVGRPENPKESFKRYEEFITECSENGYIGSCAEELWEKAVTYATRTNCNNLSRLKIIRMERGLSQAQLAEISKVPVRAIQMYEQKERPLKNYETINQLSEALGVEPKEIV